MSGGEIPAIMAVANIGSKLLGGGGAQAAPAGAPVPGPFDAIMSGQPGGQQPPAPPLPARNSLFAGAQLTPGKPAQAKPAASAPPAMPTRNPLFTGGIDGGAPASVAPPAMPVRNSLFATQPGEAERGAQMMRQGGMFSGAPSVYDELADKPLTGGQDMPKPAQTSPAAPARVFDNNDLARSQGFTVETIRPGRYLEPGEEFPLKGRAGAPPASVDVGSHTPSSGGLLPPVEADSEAPVQASTLQAAPKPDVSEFDRSAPAPGKKPQGGLFGLTIPGVGEVNSKLAKSSTNPLFQVGMGLLSSGYDGSNPFTQMNAGMGRIPGLEIAGNQDGRAQSKADQEAAEMAEMREIMALLAGTKTANGEDDEDARGGRVAKQAAKVVR